MIRRRGTPASTPLRAGLLFEALGDQRRREDLPVQSAVRRCQAKPETPDACGYEHHLYSVAGYAPDQQEIIEENFMRRTDQLASDALDWMELRSADPMNPTLRSAWSRFMMSLLQRSPRRVAQIAELAASHFEEVVETYRDQYPELRRPIDPETFDQFKQERFGNRYFEAHRAIYVQRLSDLEGVGNHLNGMNWQVLENPSWSLLTSDRPVIMSNGIGHQTGHIAVPVGPQRLFLAANNRETLSAIARMSEDRSFQSTVNGTVVTNAERFVFGEDDRHLRFIENRLRRDPQPPIRKPKRRRGRSEKPCCGN